MNHTLYIQQKDALRSRFAAEMANHHAIVKKRQEIRGKPYGKPGWHEKEPYYIDLMA